MRRAALATGGILLIAGGIAVAQGWMWPSTTERTARVTAAVDRVEIDNDSGDVTVRAADVRTTVVRQFLRHRGSDEPGEAYRVEGSTLWLNGCGRNCSAQYQVTVPRDTTVAGGVDSGDITVEGTGDVRVTADSGDITLRLDGAATVSAEADSGDISLTLDDVGDVTARASSGDISLWLTGVDHVRARADSGDIDATVPPGRYRVTGESDSGDRDIAVVHDPYSDRVLELTTASGEVSVRQD